MTVSFNEMPSDILTPAHYVEIDPTGAIESSGTRPHKALIIGYRLNGGAATDTSGVTFPTGTVAQYAIKRVSRSSEAEAYAGRGSQAARMAAAFLSINERTPLYLMGIDDPAGTNATGTVTFTASTPSAGVVNVYIAGTRYQVPTTTGSTPTTLAATLASLVNADLDAPVTGKGALGVCTLTAKHPGPEGNAIDIRISYREGETVPSGVTAVAVQMASGATSVSLSAAITALGGTQYDTIVSGLRDAANMTLLEAELRERWGPTQAIDGQLFVGICENLSDTSTYTTAPARNSEHTTVIAAGLSPTAEWIAAADAAAHDAAVTTDDPARPRTTLICKNVLPPSASDLWGQAERNLLLQSGAATLKNDASGNVIIERLTTTYQKNAQGAIDRTWLDLSVKRTVSYLRWSWSNRLITKYPRHKLANDGTKFDAGQAVVTPSTIRSEAVAWFEEMETLGLVEGRDQFREDLIVERSTTDLNRIDAILRPNAINKFVVSATRMQPRI